MTAAPAPRPPANPAETEELDADAEGVGDLVMITTRGADDVVGDEELLDELMDEGCADEGEDG